MNSELWVAVPIEHGEIEGDLEPGPADSKTALWARLFDVTANGCWQIGSHTPHHAASYSIPQASLGPGSGFIKNLLNLTFAKIVLNPH